MQSLKKNMRFIDLFAGIGGFHYGIEKAGDTKEKLSVASENTYSRTDKPNTNIGNGKRIWWGENHDYRRSTETPNTTNGWDKPDSSDSRRGKTHTADNGQDLNNMVSYTHGKDGKLDDRTLESKEKLREENEQMYGMPRNKKNGNPSSKRQLARQSGGELSGDMSELSYETSQKKTIMQGGGVREDTSEERILRETQSTLQEIRQSDDVQEKPTQPDYRIRRLTVVECERLQGFPDNWTQYGADGELISDTQRYKMAGNAVTVNVITAIVSRLK
jgi:site-specific DNA-cytosine methylase